MTTLSAKSRPSDEPTYTVLLTTTGDDSTGAPVFSCQSSRPVARSNAVTVPPCELTISRGPAIAGVDAVNPGARRDQIFLPVSASIATVLPFSRFT